MDFVAIENYPHVATAYPIQTSLEQEVSSWEQGRSSLRGAQAHSF